MMMSLMGFAFSFFVEKKLILVYYKLYEQDNLIFDRGQ